MEEDDDDEEDEEDDADDMAFHLWRGTDAVQRKQYLKQCRRTDEIFWNSPSIPQGGLCEGGD